MDGRDSDASRPFLTARWSNVVPLTFEAPEDLVRTQLPPGVEPDRWNGKTHASLVALEMRDVRVRAVRVTHPPWAVRTIVSVDYAVDFAALYGPAWQFLNHARPVSTVLAVGSDVAVYPPRLTGSTNS